MVRVALKGLLAHKLRLVMTALSIVLGVAFVAGSFVFTDTIEARFDNLFQDVYAGVDATVRAEGSAQDSAGGSIPETALDVVLELDGVETAAGGVGGYAQMIAADGTPIGGQGPPTLGFSWVGNPALNSLTISPENGRAPETAGEVAIDVATANAQDLRVGDRIDIQTEQGLDNFEIVGLANFGSEDNLAGATLTAFILAEAQTLFDLEGRFTSIDVIAKEEISSEQLVTELQTAFGDDLEVVTGEQQTQEQLDQVTEGLGFLNTALLAFAGIAVFVGGFVIQNTFRITVAQRTRELGLLRAVGATGRQVMTSVFVEALVLALFASAIGVGAGVGVASLIKSGMNSLGFGLPEGPLTLEPRTVVVAMIVGIVVTVAAAIIPARKAASISPMAALSDPAARTKRKSLRNRTIVGSILLAMGVGAMTTGLLLESSSSLTLVGLGALGLFLGASTLAPLIAARFTKIIAAPFRGITGKLARDNTARQPRRTASTASALMIGVALVAFVSIFAASIKASVTDTLDAAFPADLAFQSSSFTAGVSPVALDSLAALDEVDLVSGIRGGYITIDGDELNVFGVDPATIGAVYDAKPSADLSRLGDGIMVQRDVLTDRGWTVGQTVDVTYLGEPIPTEIVGTFEDQTFGNFMISQDTFTANLNDDIFIAFVDLADGVELQAGKEAAAAALVEFPTLDINTKSDQAGQAEEGIDQLVALFSGLLGLALLIAVLGIANTLALSIVERTREVGLLRAVGMIRKQVRQLIRREAVITAVFGALLGLLIGIGIGWGITTSLADDGLGSFALPIGQLLIWLAVAALAGVLAAIGPARKAAKMDILQAIAHE